MRAILPKGNHLEGSCPAGCAESWCLATLTGGGPRLLPSPQRGERERDRPASLATPESFRNKLSYGIWDGGTIQVGKPQPGNGDTRQPETARAPADAEDPGLRRAG